MVLITLQTKEISSSLSRFKEDINLKKWNATVDSKTVFH